MKDLQFVHKLTASLACFLLLCASLTGCALEAPVAGTEPGSTIAPVETPEPTPDPSALPESTKPNMVDERFELLGLIFRLAGLNEYNDNYTEYQNTLNSQFTELKDHSAVKYAILLPLGYDAVFKFAVHIVKDGEEFVFIDDIASLVDDGRWTSSRAEIFLPLVNDFYKESGFADFYISNMAFYETETQHFIDETYSEIDLQWFASYGADPENLRCVYSPSSSLHNYATTVNDKVIYCAVSGNGDAIVHEYCHSFANPISDKWYTENSDFKKLSDDSVDLTINSAYPNGKIMAREYLTRAYNTLYYAEHGYAVYPLFANEKRQGFPYIEEVYSMIAPLERPEPGDDLIEFYLGMKYEMEPEQSVAIGERVLRWSVLTLESPMTLIYSLSEIGNVFNSETGDVLYFQEADNEAPYLLIDIGAVTYQGQSGYRGYSRITLE